MAPPDSSPKGLRAYSIFLAAAEIVEPGAEKKKGKKKKIGESAAQLFHRIWYFCVRAKSGGKVIKGRRWIRNSHQQWQKDHFPHWDLSTIRRALKTLMDHRLILAKNLNREKHVNTQWYTVNLNDPRLKDELVQVLVQTGYVQPKGYVQNEQACSKRTDAMVKMNRGRVQNEQMGVFKMSTSDHRDLIRDNQGRQSSLLRDDEQLQKSPKTKKDRQRKTGTKRRESFGGEENVSPETEGKFSLPPDPGDDLLKKVYGRIPPAKDFLAVKPGSVNLIYYLRPFQTLEEMAKFFSKEEIRAMDTLGPPTFEAKSADFVDRVLQSHFNGEPGKGFKVMVLRATRGGFLNRCGFKDFCERGLPDECRRPWDNVIYVTEEL